MKLREQIQAYRKWWNTWHTLPVTNWIKAAACYRAGDYDAAEFHYRRGLERHPRHPAQLCAKMDLAYCCFKLGRFKEAEELLKGVIALSPQAREAYMRLGQIQMWLGLSLEAAWTMRRALRNIKGDAELVATFLLAVLDNDGPAYLLAEAMRESKALRGSEDEKNPKLQLARARLMILKGDGEEGRNQLEKLATSEQATLNAIIAFGEVLLKEDDVEPARVQLTRALGAAPEHPRVLSLLSECYLRAGGAYNADYAVQLAISSCQKTGWASPRDMHILAEAYYHKGDKFSALLMASKAKEAGSRLLGTYREQRTLDRLIESLSSGSLA